MATRAEQYRSNEQRKGAQGGAGTRARKKAKKSSWSKERHHADVKASFVLEDTTPGKRPSRKSTRKSSNRIKADAARNITEEVRQGAPPARAGRTRAKRSKVRGKPRA
jgi:hypothetical protein